MNEIRPQVEEFIRGLDDDDVEMLSWLLRSLKTINGWCTVNRWIGKWLIFTAIAAIVLMSSGYDAVMRFISFLRGH